MLRCFLISLLLVVGVSGQVPLGATKQEVVEALGWPKSTSGSEEREILNYPDFYVLLANGRVEKLQYKPGKQKPPGSYKAPAPKIAPSNTVQPQVNSSVVQIGGPTQSRVASSVPAGEPRASVVPPKRMPIQAIASAPPPDVMSGLKRLFVIVAVALMVLAGLKIWAKEKRRQQPRKGDVFARAVSPTGAAPPILVQRCSVSAKPDPLTVGWSMSLLKEIEWHRFEHVVAAYERELGNEAELTDFGPDGGIDVRVFEKDTLAPKRVIQCKAYENQIGVELVRGFYGAMTLEKVSKGAFYTTSSFSDAALAIGRTDGNLDLVDGPTFLHRIQRLTLPAQIRLFEVATEGDYTTPTCPNCGVKMVIRTARKGRNAGNDFWACAVPRCNHIINIRRA